MSTATLRPRGLGVVESSEATSTSSSETARITPAWRKSASTAASEPASAASESLPRAGRSRRPALQRQHRLRARCAAPDVRSAARPNDLRRGYEHEPVASSSSYLEQSFRRDVRLVADRHERGEPEPARLRRPPATRGRGRSGRRSRCCRSARSGSWKVALRLARDRDAEAVRRSAVRRARGRASSRSCRSIPSLPTSAEAGGDDQRARIADLAAPPPRRRRRQRRAGR